MRAGVLSQLPPKIRDWCCIPRSMPSPLLVAHLLNLLCNQNVRRELDTLRWRWPSRNETIPVCYAQRGDLYAQEGHMQLAGRSLEEYTCDCVNTLRLVTPYLAIA